MIEKADLVEAMLAQDEIVEKFNRIYGKTLVLPTAMIPENEM